MRIGGESKDFQHQLATLTDMLKSLDALVPGASPAFADKLSVALCHLQFALDLLNEAAPLQIGSASPQTA
jgi:hypothetical protein